MKPTDRLPRTGAFCIFSASAILFFSTGCVPATPSASPAPTATPVPSRTPTSSSTATFVPTATDTGTPTTTATQKWPLTIVFYGDSMLKLGEAGQPANNSYSFVDDLRAKLDPAYQLITSNHGGRDAEWGADNIGEYALAFDPDSVTLWWGFNDLLGCGGFFDRSTNKLIQTNLDRLIEHHIANLRRQVDTLLGNGLSVIVLTAIPVDGGLPWTHKDEKGEVVWEWSHRCDFNTGLEQLAAAQRLLIGGYIDQGFSIHLMDAWQLYLDHQGENGMYLDMMHPGIRAAMLLSEEWIRVFGETGLILRRKT
jgi:lysophospholipase L1-like esterase